MIAQELKYDQAAWPTIYKYYRKLLKYHLYFINLFK